MSAGAAGEAAKRGGRDALAIVLLAGLACLAAAGGWLLWSANRPDSSAPATADVRELLGGLRFEASRGQVDERIDFIARGAGYQVSLSNRGASIGLDRRGERRVVGMTVLGAAADARATGVGGVVGRSNYLIGPDRRRWHRNIPSFDRVRYHGVYPGIDMVYRGSGERLEYDFLVAPGADARDIALRFTGGRVSLTPGGDLLVRAPDGTLRQKRPFAFQRIGGTRRKVPSRFVLKPRGRVTFQVGPYDRSRPLVIDPQLVYSTYVGAGTQGEGLGGPGAEVGEGVAVDASGAAYVVGTTGPAPPFPTRGAIQATSGGGTDAVITKINPSGSDIVYSTYLGGGAAERGFAVAVNSAGEAYVTGQTASPGTTPATAAPFPTRNPIQGANGGAAGTIDAFVAKLNAAGNDLLYSTYLGGSGSDRSFGIGLDSTGAAYVTGATASINFPMQSPIDGTHNGGDDVFVAKLNAPGSALVYSTYLGGSGSDGAEGIAVNRTTGEAYLAGGAASGFPVTAGAFQTTNAANSADGFVARVNAAGSALVYSTYLGGGGSDRANGVAIDSGGAAYVTGQTASGDFPTQAPIQGTRGGANTDDDVFITKLNAAGSAAVYSTYFGGASPDQGNAIDVDSTGAAHVGGTSEGSGNFPLVNPIGRGSGNQDALLVKLNPSGSSAVYSTLLGGSDGDLGYGVAAGPGGAYLVGHANAYASPPGNFPTTSGAFQAQPPGGSEIFVAKVADAPAAPLVTSLRSRSGPTTGGTRVTINGTGLSGARAVRFGGTPAASFTVESPTRITAVSPARALGRVKVTVTTAAGTSPPNPAATFEYAEGTWTQTGSLTDTHFSAPMVLLGDGRVLLPSGLTSKAGPTTVSSEIYNPKTRSWSKTADMATSRHTHTGTLLGGPACRSASRPAYCGKVLVTGGFAPGPTTGDQAILDSAELYDPATGTWAGAGTMNVRRALHAATLLDGPPCRTASPPSYCGKVLVVGGRTCGQPPPAGCAGGVRTNTAELYDPATGSWTATGSMLGPRNNFKLATLPDGQVLAVAGFGSTLSAETYNPATGSWATTDALRSRTRTSAAMLPDGRVLAVSGFGANNTVDVYDPASRAWQPAPNIGISYRFNYYYATLPSGKVLFAAGTSGGETAEAYDATTNQWVSAGLLNFAYGPAAGPGDTTYAVVLSSDPDRFAADSAECGNDCGKVLIAGNHDEKPADLYTPPPRVDAVSPRGGSGSGGTTVTITGQGFTHNVRAVRFGNTPATRFRVDSYGRITAVAPPHAAGAVTVTVINEGGAASRAGAFTFAAVPPRYGQPSAAFPGCASASANLIRGSAGADVLTGTDRGDRIFAAAGNDRADGRAGADCVDLGSGTDRGAGGSGADLILGGIGRDRLSGGSGGDRLRGGSSGDTISGGGSRDRIVGESGNDRLGGSSGNDSVTGSSGRDRLSGGSGRDRLSGGSGRDRLSGGSGRDRLSGGSSGDRIAGNSGGDRISGGSGSDRLSGGSGNDRISARDRRRDRITCGRGRDRVTADRRDRVSRNCERVRRR